jgi:hypothetical protein
MLKRILEISWKITKVTVKMIIVITFVISLYTINHKLNLLTEVVDEKYQNVNDRYNQVIENELELLTQIQDSLHEGKVTDSDLLTKIITLNKTINELKANNVDVTKLLKSDVFVRSFFGEGAGTIIKKTDKNMYILTCYHVVAEIIKLNQEGLKMVATVGYSKNDKTDTISGLTVYGAEVIKYDEENDLALLRTSVVDDELETVNLAENEPEKGDKVYSVGSPLGLYRTISTGIIANKLEGFYFSDNTTTYGNSGGGLYNVKGELIGVPSNVMGYAVAKKLGYDRFLTDEEGKFVPETSLGLSISLFRIKAFLEGVDY